MTTTLSPSFIVSVMSLSTFTLPKLLQRFLISITFPQAPFHDLDAEHGAKHHTQSRHAAVDAKAAAKPAGAYTVTGEGDPAIDAMVMARYEAKKAKNWAEADRIRDELKAQGIEIIDTPQGAKWRRV